MTEKIVGYVLLIVGVAIILFSGFTGLNILMGRTAVPDVIELSGLNLDLGALYGVSSPTGSLQTEIISQEDINKPVNLIVSLMFLGFFVSVGARLASLGTNLVRPIVVKARGEKEEKSTS